MALFDLSGRVAVVTGGTGVLGGAIGRGLAAAGATVIALARRAEGENTVRADVLNKAELDAAAAAILAQHGRIDILINAAGGNRPEATAVPDKSTFFDLPEDALQWVLNLNLMGTLLPCQAFGRAMADAGQGVILNVSSMAAYQPLTRVVAYAAAKAGINNFTQWLAVYMAQQHNPAIRVNAIAPGFFVGDQNRYLLFDRETGDLTPRGRSIIAHTPMGRFGDPDDLVGAALWLVSDAARFVTGVVVPVDGGFSAFSGV